MLECLLQISINGLPVSESRDVVSNALGLCLQEKNRKLPPVMATASASMCKLLDTFECAEPFAARSASSTALLTFVKDAGSFPMGKMRD